MQQTIPATPADALEIPTGLRLALRGVCACADLFGFWKVPAAGAATDFAEMTLLDKMYWAYKSRQPITRAGAGEFDEHYFRQSRHEPIRLPQEFDKKQGVTLGAAGDLIAAEGVEASRDLLYEQVADLLFAQDISYANLESVLTAQPLGKEVLSDKESPVECCSQVQFQALQGHRGRTFTVLHTACNHTLDRGVEGVRTTLRQLARDTILAVGTNGEPAQQPQGRILSRNGIKIGFVSATFSLNGRELPPGEEHLVNLIRLLPRRGKADLSLLEKQIAFCRGEGCDFIVASLHWGYEFEFFPRQKQVEIAHTLVELGADLILSHHPHVIQPIEYYRTRRDPDRIAVIAYSLGTLVWSFTAPHLVLSAILNLSLAKGVFRGREITYIESARTTPVFRRYVGEGKRLRVQIEKLQETGATEPEEYLAEIRKYAELVLGKEDGCTAPVVEVL